MTVLEAITQIISDRKSKHIVPECAMISDVKKLSGLNDDEFREECRELKREGKIEIKETINSFSIYLK